MAAQRFLSKRSLIALGSVAVLALLAGLLAPRLVERIRYRSMDDNALRQEVPAPVQAPAGPAAPGVIAVLSDQPVAGSTVRFALDAPADAQAVQVSLSPGFEDASWLPVAPELSIDIDHNGYQTVFARFLSPDGTPGPISVTGVEIDHAWAEATSSDRGAHQPSWVRPFSPTELAVRIEAGRLVTGAIEPYDLDNPLSGDKVRTRRGVTVVERDGEVYGFQVSKRRDAIRRPDRLVGSSLDIDAVIGGRWTISSPDDPLYAEPTEPVELDFVAKPGAMGTDRDLDRVAEVTYDLVLDLATPMTPGATYLITPPSPVAEMTLAFDPVDGLSPAVRVNQVGYAPNDRLKVGYLSGWFDGMGSSAITLSDEPEFRVVNRDRGDVVLRGVGRLRQADDEMGKGDLTGSPVFELDFSTVATTGRYQLCVELVGCSHAFRIADGTWHQLTATVARAMYHQRSGVELGPPFTPFSRPRPYHPEDGVTVVASDYTLLQAQTETDNTDFALLAERRTSLIQPDAWGGHFDAGDWDRRINHLWYVRNAAQLVMQFPGTFGDRDFHIPESGDPVPDLLDEALWSLDLYRRMQGPDGSIRGGIEASGHPPYNTASWVDDLAVFAYEPDPYSSYIYAGVAAEVAAALQPYDQVRAAEYLDSAVAAMAWADGEAVADVAAEAVDEQRNVAAAAFLMATGERQWHDRFVESAQFLDRADPLMSCHAHGRCDAAWLYLQADEAVTDQPIREELRRRFTESADAVMVAASGTAYGWAPENPFVPLVWGLGPGGAPHVSGLLKAYALTGDENYRNAALRSTSVTLGANAMNRVMITGLGAEPVRNPQINDIKNGGLPTWAGTPVYGNHTLNLLADDQWVIDDVLGPTGASPDPSTLPYLWQWYDVPTVALFNEFTVHQSHADALLAFGTLAATAADPPVPPG